MRHLALFTSVIISLTIFSNAHAAQIKSVKGKKVLVDMESDNFNKGDVLKVQNSSGKTIGLVKIMKTKGSLAQGLLKGKAQKGSIVVLRQKKSGGQSSSTASYSSPARSGSNDKMSLGIMGGFNSSSAEIKLPVGETVSLTGTGFSLKGLLDYPLLSWLNFRGLVGLEQFNVGGASNASSKAAGGCAGECIAEISYLTFDMWGRYVMGSGSFRPWIGIGFQLMFPISKSATALDESSITNTSTSPAAAGGGVDWYISPTSYIPIQIEYVPYPSTDDVQASAIAGKIGYSFNF